MATERLSMRKIREMLRLRFEGGLSNRTIAKSLSIARSTVAECLDRAAKAGLAWPLDPKLDDGALEAMLYAAAASPKKRTEPDCRKIHQELLRHKHVTLSLLWQEYKADHPKDGYQYTQFCAIFRRFQAGLDVVMRHEHRAGEKVFVDFSGDGIPIVDRKTGEIREAQLFVATLGASSYTFVEALASQKLPCWIEGHIHAYEYFQGVAEITVPDQPRTSVKNPCRYEPDINPTYLEMSQHYGTVIIPARPREPRDKAKAECGVLVAQRWILAKLRKYTFFSIPEANVAVRELNEELNDKKFNKLDTTRRELYLKLDRPALKPLPPTRYEYAEWSNDKGVNIDYHVEIARHYYSVPFELAKKRVDVRWNAKTVEIFFKGQRVASHPFDPAPGRFSTRPEHMPKSHRQHLEWTPSRMVNWARKIGPDTARLVEAIIKDRPHPEQGYRSCLGVIRLEKRYGQQRLEAACRRAVSVGARSYKSVALMLSKGLDSQPLPKKPGENNTPLLTVVHENIRGPDYYKEE